MKKIWRRKRLRCPHCGSRRIAAVVYGLPDMTDRMAERIDDGKLILGGCMPRGIYWKCGRCGAGFPEKPFSEARMTEQGIRLRHGIRFGDLVEEVVRRETAEPYLDRYRVFSTEEFVRATDGVFRRLREAAGTPGTDAVRKAYKAEFGIVQPRPGASENVHVAEIRPESWGEDAVRFARGKYVIWDDYGLIPCERENEKWYLCRWDAVDRECRQQYVFDEQTGGLARMKYSISCWDFNARDMNADAIRLRRALYDACLACREKYGEPLVCTGDGFSGYGHVFAETAEQKVHEELCRMLTEEGSAGRSRTSDARDLALWKIHVPEGVIMVCLYGMEHRCSYRAGLDRCGENNPEGDAFFTDENACSLLYCFLPEETYRGMLPEASRRYREKDRARGALERKPPWRNNP